ncbi:unnamed protein product [Larinioides sclopetarius]|uniref:Uncharacterized protein n=1 Tax=Larinioides sclopetarius TaxID=280406 RepID=A0AAV2AFM1_9ARAC
MIKRELAGIVENLNGKCGNVQGSRIEIKFPSTEASEKAKRRLEQEILGGKPILVQFVETQEGVTNPEGGNYVNVGASTSKPSVLPVEKEAYSEDDELSESRKLNQASK